MMRTMLLLTVVIGAVAYIVIKGADIWGILVALIGVVLAQFAADGWARDEYLRGLAEGAANERRLAENQRFGYRRALDRYGDGA
jgi:hypothetical protein